MREFDGLNLGLDVWKLNGLIDVGMDYRVCALRDDINKNALPSASLIKISKVSYSFDMESGCFGFNCLTLSLILVITSSSLNVLKVNTSTSVSFKIFGATVIPFVFISSGCSIT